VKKGLACRQHKRAPEGCVPQGSPGDLRSRRRGEDSHEALIGDARGGTRTRTLLRAATFKVAASTSWATRAGAEDRTQAAGGSVERDGVVSVDQTAANGLSADLLGQRDDDPLGAADVAEPVAVLVLHHLSNELRAVGSQTGDSGVDVVDGEHDAT
jgi:hypothetical protein